MDGENEGDLIEKERSEGPMIGPEDLDPAVEAVMKAQAPYMEFDEHVRQIAASLQPSPLAGTRLDVENKQLTVYWKGTVPGELIVLRDRAANSGFVFNIVRAPFSEEQLRRAASELTSAVPDETHRAMMIEIDTEGTGLIVHFDGLPTAQEDSTSATLMQRELLAVIDSLRPRYGMAIRVADAASIVQALTD